MTEAFGHITETFGHSITIGSLETGEVVRSFRMHYKTAVIRGLAFHKLLSTGLPRI